MISRSTTAGVGVGGVYDGIPVSIPRPTPIRGFLHWFQFQAPFSLEHWAEGVGQAQEVGFLEKDNTFASVGSMACCLPFWGLWADLQRTIGMSRLLSLVKLMRACAALTGA